MSALKLTWYGRCCFLIEKDGTSLLLDPYDTFTNTDMGHVDANYTIVSSIAHDHGNVACSPLAMVYGYRGRYALKKPLVFNGIESKEGRGTLNLICNLELDPFFLTNFADWGDPECVGEFTSFEKDILKRTNIAFVRTREQEKDKEHKCYELAMQVSSPRMLIPQHHFPRSFFDQFIIKEKHHICDEKLQEIDEFIAKNPEYKKRVIEGYQCELTEEDLKGKTILLFEHIHPQVKQLGHDF